MNRWKRWLPGLRILSEYQAAWFPRDVMAGLVLATMLVPVGIAYYLASGVPGIYGLYATIVPLLAYALFGPSRILVLGPDSSLAPVILAVVFPLSGGDAMRAVSREHDGGCLGLGMRVEWCFAPGICHGASLEAGSLRLHERHRADSADQPTAKALRFCDGCRW